MKKSNLIFTALLVPMDYFMLFLAGISAYFIRTSDAISQWRPVLFNLNLPLGKYAGIVFFVSIFWLVIFAVSGLYKIRRINRPLEEFLKIVVACSAGLMAIIVYIFIKGQFFDSRFVILVAWILAVLLVAFGRIFIRTIQRFLLFNYGYGVSRAIVVGNDKITKNMVRDIKNTPELGIAVVGEIEKLNLVELEKIADKINADEILLGEANHPNGLIVDLMDFCQERQIDLKFVPSIFQAAATNIEIDTALAVPIIELKKTALTGWGKIAKRIIDFIIALICLIFFSPIMAIIALLVKLDSNGPIIYKNLRVGPDGNFDVFKFRSMQLKYCTGEKYPHHKEASEFEDQLAREKNLKQGPVFKIGGDPRRTRVGRFLEKWSLDELPQFWNVLKGEMSLVGPRPHMPKEVAGYQKHHKKVFNIKPGITGLAQISGISDLDFEEEAKIDIYYIENWSLGLDIKIMLKTPFVALFGKHKS